MDDVLSVSGIKEEIKKSAPEGKNPGVNLFFSFLNSEGKFYQETLGELVDELCSTKGKLALDDLLAPRMHKAHSLLEELEEALQRLNKIRKVGS
jgi:hypothetical protein